jgi:hypothetical protein
MARGPSIFRQEDALRALRAARKTQEAARKQGISVVSEVVAGEGKIKVVFRMADDRVDVECDTGEPLSKDIVL